MAEPIAPPPFNAKGQFEGAEFARRQAANRAAAASEKQAAEEQEKIALELVRYLSKAADAFEKTNSALYKTEGQTKKFVSNLEKVLSHADAMGKVLADPRWSKLADSLKHMTDAYASIKAPQIAGNAKAEAELAKAAEKFGGGDYAKQLAAAAREFNADVLKTAGTRTLNRPQTPSGFMQVGKGQGLTFFASSRSVVGSKGTPLMPQHLTGEMAMMNPDKHMLQAAVDDAQDLNRMGAQVQRMAQEAQEPAGPRTAKGLQFGPEPPKVPEVDNEGLGASDVLAMFSGPAGAVWESLKAGSEFLHWTAKQIKPATEGLETLSKAGRAVGLTMDDISKATVGGGAGGLLGYSKEYAAMGYGQEDVAGAIKSYGLSQNVSLATMTAARLAQASGTGAMDLNQWSDLMGTSAGAGLMSTTGPGIVDFAKTMSTNIQKGLKAGVPAQQFFDAYGKTLGTLISTGINMSPDQVARDLALAMQTGSPQMRTGAMEAGFIGETATVGQNLLGEPFEMGSISQLMGPGNWTWDKIRAKANANGANINDISDSAKREFDAAGPAAKAKLLDAYNASGAVANAADWARLKDHPEYAPLVLSGDRLKHWEMERGNIILPNAMGGTGMSTGSGFGHPYGIDPNDPEYAMKYLEESSKYPAGDFLKSVTNPDLTAGRMTSEADVAAGLITSAAALRAIGDASVYLSGSFVELSKTVDAFVTTLKATGSLSAAGHDAGITPGAKVAEHWAYLALKGVLRPYVIIP